MNSHEEKRVEMNENGPLGEHPAAQLLRSEVDVLARELTERLTELHDLEHIARPNLLALYQSKLGPWELRLLEAECDAARWKRRCELARAALNRGEMFDPALIEVRLEHEFHEWKARIAAAADKIQRAQFRLSNTLSAADDAEFKRLFRCLARRLHPDLNPQAEPEGRSLWDEVLAAYETGDLERLRALAIMLEHDARPAEAVSSLEMLQTEHARLRQSLEGIYRHLAEVRKQPPFSLAVSWLDAAWLARRREEIDRKIVAATAQARAFREQFPALKGGHGTRQQPRLN